ncbi:MAG: hypothetical protein WKF65_08505 [Gaiellaceae bacterium]
MTLVRELGACIFCGDSDMTEEHVVADWVSRAFEGKRRPGPGLSGSFVSRQSMRLLSGEAISTAKVTCRRCNNEWLSQIDNAAASVLKPLIRGDDAVSLGTSGQAVFGTWAYRAALIFDALEEGNNGRLATHRAVRGVSSASRELDCSRGAGSTDSVHGPGDSGGGGPTALRRGAVDGLMRLTINAESAEGTVANRVPTEIPIPAYQVMLGAVFAYMEGHVRALTSERSTCASGHLKATLSPCGLTCADQPPDLALTALDHLGASSAPLRPDLRETALNEAEQR